jgi:hypothetical protein
MKVVGVCLFFSVAVIGSARSTLADLVQVSGLLTGQAFDRNIGADTLSCNIPSCALTEIDSDVSVPLELALDGSVEAGVASATVHAVANAIMGKIGVGILGAAVSPQGGSAVAGATNISASWTTTETLVSPSRPIGTRLKIYASLFLDGDLSGTATGKGSASAFLQIIDLSTFNSLPPSPYANNGWGNRFVAPSSTPPIDLLEEIPGVIRVIQNTRNGAMDSVGYRLVLSGGANSDATRTQTYAGSGTFSADVSNSLRWGGIEKVTDEFDNLIDDWTITSESGFDFSKPFGVPEPSSLVLAGIALCFGRSLRNRRSQAYWT